MYATAVNNKANQIQNDAPPITWVEITGEYQGIVEDFTYSFAAINNMGNWSTQKKNCFLQGVFFWKQILIMLQFYLLYNM